MIPLAIVVAILCLLVWAAFSRIYDLDREIFELKYPKLNEDDDLFAAYLGKADE